MTMVPDTYDGTTPHPDPRRERFCQLVARGEERANAYRQAIARGEVTGGTARSNGLKLYRRPDVQARIAVIRAALSGERQADDAPLDRDDILELMRSVTESYQTAINALEAMGGNPATVAKLRSDLVVHVGRLHRQAPTKNDRHAASADDNTMFADALERLPLCACQRAGEARPAP